MSQQNPYQLNDRFLIDWLKSNYQDITFITTQLAYEAHERTKKLVGTIEKLTSDEFLYKQKDEVTEIWRDLIGKAIVYLKFRDEREEHHDDEDYGVEKLDEFFKTFREFERLLYAEERYRDHMAHMLSVFLLGEYLLRETIGFEKINVGDELLEDKKISAEEKEAMWCIMALTHDLGMALEKVAVINPKVKDMLEKFGIINMQELSFPFFVSPLHDFTIRFISSDLQPLAGDRKGRFILHVQNKYLQKFSEAYERRDHGIISCLVLMKNLVYFLETDYSLDSLKPLDLDDTKQFLIRRNILRAIASHSNENIYYLSLPQFPFLLTIFDELHEWGRPRLIEMFGEEKLKRTVTVENLSETAIHYKFVFTCDTALGNEERQDLKKELRKYFIGRCEKIRRILRSAVGGKDRKLMLTFEVVDQLEAKAKGYMIIHETPETVKYSIDNKEISWLQLLAEAP